MLRQRRGVVKGRGTWLSDIDCLFKDQPWLDGIVRAKRPLRLPVVLTRDEVRAVIGRLDGAHRVIDRATPCQV
jgi:hypothetical protein